MRRGEQIKCPTIIIWHSSILKPCSKYETMNGYDHTHHFMIIDKLPGPRRSRNRGLRSALWRNSVEFHPPVGLGVRMRWITALSNGLGEIPVSLMNLKLGLPHHWVPSCVCALDETTRKSGCWEFGEYRYEKAPTNTCSGRESIISYYTSPWL